MRVRLLTALATAGLLVALPTSAHAARGTTLKVRDCQVGETPKERRATFYARMRAVPGTARMQMRFTLLNRAEQRTAAVGAPELARWRRSRPGVRRFGYTQTVAGLEPGGSYAMAVDFRWRNAAGRTIRSRRRVSGTCRQDGELPNLAIAGVSSRPGVAPGTEVYEIEVVNRGRGTAREFDVGLIVDSAAADSARIHELKSGEAAIVMITGPRCVGRIRAVADVDDAVSETNGDDNTLRSPCPI